MSHIPESLAIKNRIFLIFVLTSCGWLINIPKHEPVAQYKIFLGLAINSINMELEVPDSKLVQFFEVLKSVKFQVFMPIRLPAHLLGLLNSFSRALGQVVRLMTRNLYSCLHPAYFSKERWSSLTSLSDSAKEELNFWETNISKLNGYAIAPISPSITTCEVIAGDASGEGLYAAHFSDKNQTVFF